jgi:cell division protein FtsQ
MAIPNKNNSSKIIKLPTDFTGVSGQQLSRDEIRSRKKKRLKRRRAIRKAILSLFMLFVVAIVGFVLAVTVFFKIDTIKAKGSGVYPQKIIIENSGVATGDSLLLVSEKAISENLFFNLPYVGSVTIEKDLPSTLIINVIDTVASAAISNNKGSYIIINDEGKVLNADSQVVTEGIPVVSGVEVESYKVGEAITFKTEETGDILIQLLKASTKAGIIGMTEIDLTDVSAITMKYDNRIKILVGPAVKLETKILRAASAIDRENEINQYETGVLDLRTDPKVFFKAGLEETTEKNSTSKDKNKDKNKNKDNKMNETTETTVKTSEN